MSIVKLSFTNITSREASDDLWIEQEKAHLVARWYGAYCAGDDYEIRINNRIIPHDLNGEIGDPVK